MRSRIAVLLLALCAAVSLAAVAKAADAEPKITLALVGGQIIDGYEGTPISDGIVLIAGDRITAVGRRSEIPVPGLFVSGPFIQKKAYAPHEESYRWGVNGAADARAKVKRVVDAGVDVVKLIDQDQLTDDEVKAVVDTAHAGGKPVVAHAH